MKQFVPIEKKQKKLQREMAAKQRGSWGGLNPVTRKPENPKAYNRKKAGLWRKDSSHGLLLIIDRCPAIWAASKSTKTKLCNGLQVFFRPSRRTTQPC